MFHSFVSQLLGPEKGLFIFKGICSWLESHSSIPKRVKFPDCGIDCLKLVKKKFSPKEWIKLIKLCAKFCKIYLNLKLILLKPFPEKLETLKWKGNHCIRWFWGRGGLSGVCRGAVGQTDCVCWLPFRTIN